jgi:hypothetical protein
MERILCPRSSEGPVTADQPRPDSRGDMPDPDRHSRLSDGVLFLMFCRSQSAIGALGERERLPRIRDDLVR